MRRIFATISMAIIPVGMWSSVAAADVETPPRDGNASLVATDLEGKQAVAGAQVRVYDVKGRVVVTGATDAAGRFVLPLGTQIGDGQFQVDVQEPPGGPWWNFDDSDGNAATGAGCVEREACTTIRVSGRTFSLPLGPTGFVNGVNGERLKGEQPRYLHYRFNRLNPAVAVQAAGGGNGAQVAGGGQRQAPKRLSVQPAVFDVKTGGGVPGALVRGRAAGNAGYNPTFTLDQNGFGGEHSLPGYDRYTYTVVLPAGWEAVGATTREVVADHEASWPVAFGARRVVVPPAPQQVIGEPGGGPTPPPASNSETTPSTTPAPPTPPAGTGSEGPSGGESDKLVDLPGWDEAKPEEEGEPEGSKYDDPYYSDDPYGDRAGVDDDPKDEFTAVPAQVEAPAVQQPDEIVFTPFGSYGVIHPIGEDEPLPESVLPDDAEILEDGTIILPSAGGLILDPAPGSAPDEAPQEEGEEPEREPSILDQIDEVFVPA